MKYNNENTLEFRQIVLEHLKRILEISSQELRDKTIVKVSVNMQTTEENEDTRKSYIQAIENLAYILIPYFDEVVQKEYDMCIKFVNAFDYKIKILCKKSYKKMCKDLNVKSIGGFGIEMKLKYSKRLFIALNKLLNRNGYLKSAVYGEGQEDEVVEEQD